MFLVFGSHLKINEIFNKKIKIFWKENKNYYNKWN